MKLKKDLGQVILMMIVMVMVVISVGYFQMITLDNDNEGNYTSTLEISEINESSNVDNKENIIKILTWDGYILEEDIVNINKILDEKGYDYSIEIIKPFADNAEQMFDLIRRRECDISFLTLFFIKMQNEKLMSLIEPIDVESPRLSNYIKLRPEVVELDMGVSDDGDIYYIPFGGGHYGFYGDMNKLSKEDVPSSISELLDPKWRGKYSLNTSQPWYNVSLALMSLGESPFLLNSLIEEGKRDEALRISEIDGEIQKVLNGLYENVGNFWTMGTEFNDDLLIVTSWGPEIKEQNEKGGNWKPFYLEEGSLVWLDTMNFTKGLSGRKLEASEIVANYFISENVQRRVRDELSMIPSLNFSDENLEQGNLEYYVPTYSLITENIVNQMSNAALELLENGDVNE